jgi:hypothetical protein
VKIDVESLAKGSRGKQNYNLPKWQNKTKKSDKGRKIPAAV